MTRLNPRYRFDTYVVGAANRLAVTAARAVAESPGVVYNPLFVYAGSGLGKTHLLMAIGHQALEINPQLTVEYLTLDEFVEAFHAAIAAGQGEAYRRRYADTGLLLVDDVQFLTHRREMQAELLRLTNTLLSSGQQIVLSSDRPPNEIEALDERLIQRFAGGLVIDIAGPDYETRVAILRRQSEERKAQFDPTVLEAVAGLPISSIRELIGAFNRLIAYQAVNPAPLTSQQAREVLARTMPVTVRGGPARPAELDTGTRAPTEATEAPAAAAAATAAAPMAATTQPSAPDAAPALAAAATGTGDEFGAFLAEISSAVARQVEAWRGRVAEAIVRWEGEGYTTDRLQRLLQGETAIDPDLVLQTYEEDIARLEALRAEVSELDSALATQPAFHDPDRLTEAEAEVARAREGLSPPPGPAPLWRLEDFVESAANRYAVRAARSVVEEPGSQYNPLVLVGEAGAGKSHLLHGIGNALAARDGVIVACLGAVDFVEDLIKAIERDRVTWWRARYRRIGAFLLDDVHLLTGKERTQEELFWLYNLLAEEGKQMVFTSALPPESVEGIEPRLRTRLEGGLVVELPPPDREVREAIVARLLREKGYGGDVDLAAYIAARPSASVRALQGLVQRVLEAADSERERPTAAFARQVLEGTPAAPARRSTGTRTSGLLSPTGGLRSREKMIWDWPDASDRLIEELR
jgi:chromosomal replication initiator protein